MRINAEAHSDDHVYEATFDATPWFEQATDDAIFALWEIDWGGNYAADDVAVFFEDKNADVEKLFDYLHHLAKARKTMGFECHVDGDEAMDWVRAYRPALAERIVSASEGPEE